MHEPMSSQTRVRRATLVALALLISLVFLWMIHQFLIPLLLAALLTAMVQGPHEWLRNKLGKRRVVAAGVTVVLTALLVILPVTGFITLLAVETVALTAQVRPWLEQANASELSAGLRDTELYELIRPYRDQLIERGGSLLSQIGSYAGAAVTSFMQGTAEFLLELFVMLYALFYFLIDGRTALSKILYCLPLPAEDERRMLDKFVSVTRATVKGTLVIGVLQGSLAGVAFWVAGIPGALVWGTLMAVLSAVPGVGAPLVWIPGVAYLGLTGSIGAAAALFVWCAAIVGTLDNVLRPRLVGKDTQMPDLLILLSTLGGIVLFGATGVIIGPIVAALFVTIWDLYGVAFQDVLPETDVTPPSDQS